MSPSLNNQWNSSFHSIGKGKRKKKVRKMLWKKQEGRCYYCGAMMLLDTKQSTHPRFATFDHVVAQSELLCDKLVNIRLACKACNTKKANKSEEEFRKERQKI